jgi:hypothetical protein
MDAGIESASRAPQLRRFRSVSSDFCKIGKLSKRGGRSGWLLEIHSLAWTEQ